MAGTEGDASQARARRPEGGVSAAADAGGDAAASPVPVSPPAPPVHEVELKLIARPEDVNRIRRLPAIRARAEGRARTVQLVTAYFDTPAQDLRRRGIALRVRRKGRTFVQCVKLKGSSGGGVMVRREIETRVRSLAPVVDLVDDPEVRARIESAVLGKPLEALFTTDIRRTSRRLLADDGSVVQLDLDVGSVTAAARRQDLCEVELELVSGEAPALFSIARELRAHVPLRVSVDSKAARGYRLADGTLPAPVKAARVRLDKGGTADDALAAILGSALEQVVANEPAVLFNDHPEGVHQMRVGLRRARSVLTTFSDVLPDEDRRRMNALLRDVADSLGPARDLDVVTTELVEPIAAALPDEPDVRTLASRLSRERVAARTAARAAVAAPGFSDAVLSVGEWIAVRGWRRQELSAESARLFLPAKELASDLLDRRFRRVRKKSRGFERAAPAERHRLRIDVKKLRYAVEFFRSLYKDRAATRFARRTADLQDALGLLNDVVVARALFATLDRGDDPEAARALDRASGVVTGWLAHGAAEQDEELNRRVRRVVRADRFWR